MALTTLRCQLTCPQVRLLADISSCVVGVGQVAAAPPAALVHGAVQGAPEPPGVAAADRRGESRRAQQQVAVAPRGVLLDVQVGHVSDAVNLLERVHHLRREVRVTLVVDGLLLVGPLLKVEVADRVVPGVQGTEARVRVLPVVVPHASVWARSVEAGSGQVQVGGSHLGQIASQRVPSDENSVPLALVPANQRLDLGQRGLGLLATHDLDDVRLQVGRNFKTSALDGNDGLPWVLLRRHADSWDKWP
mmetsp:Transcript_8698/g.19917  ORF Transcript_8698/g.19917 Transcript_8698/m.19917 type:complete len:248 (-) Transcript_8698:427-1170(-)